jgi:hypothetical protein
MLKSLEARYHRLHLYDPEDVPPALRVRTVAGTVLCGCGSCGDTLAEVVLTPFTTDRQLRWSVEVLQGYSEVAPGVWRWSRHAQRSPRGAPHAAPRPRFWQPLGGVITKRGELVVNGPHGRIVRARDRGHELRMQWVGLLGPGDAIMIGCQHEIPHMSRLSYEGLMREAIIDLRLMPAS